MYRTYSTLAPDNNSFIASKRLGMISNYPI